MKTVRFLFNDTMARAIVEGRKTVTRRPVIGMDHHAINTRFNPGAVGVKSRCVAFDEDNRTQAYARMPCVPGDLLIGRECWRAFGGISDVRVDYRADGGRMVIGRESETVSGAHVHCLPDVSKYEASGNRWRPSIHMPDWAARIRRRVVSVTAERVQDITEEDAVREGVAACASNHCGCGRTARRNFAFAWDSIYAEKRLGWVVNPWVWRIEFGAESVEATP